MLFDNALYQFVQQCHYATPELCTATANNIRICIGVQYNEPELKGYCIDVQVQQWVVKSDVNRITIL